MTHTTVSLYLTPIDIVSRTLPILDHALIKCCCCVVAAVVVVAFVVIVVEILI